MEKDAHGLTLRSSSNFIISRYRHTGERVPMSPAPTHSFCQYAPLRERSIYTNTGLGEGEDPEVGMRKEKKQAVMRQTSLEDVLCTPK